MSPDAARWDRLVTDLSAAGIDARLVESTYFDGKQHRATRHILIRTATRNIIIRDQWWRKNPQVWIGWDVWNEDKATSIGQPILKSPSKNRADVVRAVVAAMAVTA